MKNSLIAAVFLTFPVTAFASTPIWYPISGQTAYNDCMVKNDATYSSCVINSTKPQKECLAAFYAEELVCNKLIVMVPVAPPSIPSEVY